MANSTVIYSEASETSEYVDRLSPDYQRETALAVANRLAGDKEHRAKVAELRRRIDAGELDDEPPMDLKAMMREELGD